MTNSGWFRLQGHTGPRDADLFPEDETALGRSLFSTVARALERGRPAPAAFIVQAHHVDRFSLQSVAKRSLQARQRMLAALAGQDSVECVAVLGAFKFRGGGPMNNKWVASVFIEWPDNRWWTAWQPIGPNRSLIGDGPQIRCAVDGSPRPGGVGGWFSLARRHGLKLRIQRHASSVH